MSDDQYRNRPWGTYNRHRPSPYWVAFHDFTLEPLETCFVFLDENKGIIGFK